MGNQCLLIQSFTHVCTFRVQDNTTMFYIFSSLICWCSPTYMTRMIPMWQTCLPLLRDVDRYDSIWNVLLWGCTASCQIPVNTSILLTHSHDSMHHSQLLLVPRKLCMLINFVLYYYRNSTSVEMQKWQSDSQQVPGEALYLTWHLGPQHTMSLCLVQLFQGSEHHGHKSLFCRMLMMVYRYYINFIFLVM